jgi:hypothetical protein
LRENYENTLSPDLSRQSRWKVLLRGHADRQTRQLANRQQGRNAATKTETMIKSNFILISAAFYSLISGGL